MIAICQGLFGDMVARGISSGKITVVPNAVDRNAFAGPREPDTELVGRLSLGGRTVIGFFGSFYFYVELHVLLRALPELQRHRPSSGRTGWRDIAPDDGLRWV